MIQYDTIRSASIKRAIKSRHIAYHMTSKYSIIKLKFKKNCYAEESEKQSESREVSPLSAKLRTSVLLMFRRKVNTLLFTASFEDDQT